MDAKPRLYVRPTYREFGKAGESDLRAALDAMVRFTLIEEPASESSIMLDKTGRLPDGYRFTSSGLKQICALLSPGLFNHVRDISGVDRDPTRDREAYDFDAAIKTYNRAVRLRFDSVIAGSQRLLRHVDDKLVEGVIGPRYVPVDNADVLDRAGVAANDAGLIFRAATLAGRRMLLRYTSKITDVRFENERYHDGLHFANSEIGGESTFRAAPLLWRRSADAYAMAPFLGGRRAHVGRRLIDKLAIVFSKAGALRQDHRWLASRLATLSARPLRVTEGDYVEQEHARRVIAARLHDNGVPQVAAIRAVIAAVVGDITQAPVLGASRTPPTELGLFGALTTEAKTLYSTAQEAAERAAYELLAGRLKLK